MRTHPFEFRVVPGTEAGDLHHSRRAGLRRSFLCALFKLFLSNTEYELLHSPNFFLAGMV